MGKLWRVTLKLTDELAKKLFTLPIQPSSAIRISSIKEVDPILNSKIESLLKLSVHGFLIPPKKLVSPCPSPKPHGRYA